jgi:hypothetical protein
MEQLRNRETLSPKEGRVDSIAGYLKTHLRPGDTVQPVDWTGGVIHAMLISKARLATRFVYTFHFYHHVSTPYIQSLRRQFIRQVRASKPRYVIVVDQRLQPFVYGPDTTRSFPELDNMLRFQYRTAYRGKDYTIFERNDRNRD